MKLEIKIKTKTKLKYLENVATLNFDEEKCVGCGRCAEVCPHGVFEIDMEQDIDPRLITARIADKDACMECGACAKNCPANAIEVNAGVGCALGIMMSWFTGKEPTCGPDCDDDSSSGGCC
jgi:NAD-dependent dihydropyrimidine dehydrogenase PreA subunit